MIPDWPSERKRMVERQLRKRGIHDRRVLAAMLEVPREEFVPYESRVWSYQDEPVQIGHGQTVSQPYMIALMAQCLKLQGTETVLEVGSGSGYHAAVLALLAAKVITIELVPELADLARRNLKKTGRGHNVEIVCGDGSEGCAAFSPYHAISVGAGAPEVPPALLRQLNDPGKLVIPVGPLCDQQLLVVTKENGKVSTRVAAYCRFVPLRGGQGWQ